MFFTLKFSQNISKHLSKAKLLV
uniref:Uncharacterized protein n=1 Tax=Anguilla anguilla TaxID=7936 RepID=A0A0E9RUI9_ANGAN